MQNSLDLMLMISTLIYSEGRASQYSYLYVGLCFIIFLHLFLFFVVLLNFADLLIVDLAVMDLFPFLQYRLVSFIFCQL